MRARPTSLGVLAIVLLLVLGISGLVLAPHVHQVPELAAADVVDLREGVGGLGGVRSLHRWVAEAVVVVTFLHLFRVFMAGGYRPPRRGNWVLGVGLLALILGAHATGLAVVWDRGGSGALTMLLGGPLPRGGPAPGVLWTLHCLGLPVLLGALVGLHWRWARRPPGERGDEKRGGA